MKSAKNCQHQQRFQAFNTTTSGQPFVLVPAAFGKITELVGFFIEKFSKLSLRANN
jgi:hypothetical protein